MTVDVLCGDVLEVLRTLPDDHFGVVVTSPPYWGLRDYGHAGQLGLEPTLSEHLENMVDVFREVRRVMKPDGVLWVNYGDCYATKPNDRAFLDKSVSAGGYIKPKDLVMVPNRFAIAMQEDGWWVRSEIIWAKPNPMPESVKDRPATAHEKIFMFTKAPQYFYDADAVRERAKYVGITGMDETGFKNPESFNGKHKDGYRSSAPKKDKQRGHSRRHAGFNERWDSMSREEQQANGRNLRNYEPAPVQVWNIPTRPFSQAHFATFPPELVARCLRASLRNGDAVLDPFGGAGTTGLVAAEFNADCTLIEINPEYCSIINDRLRAGLVKVSGAAENPHEIGGLFEGMQ